MRQRDDDVAGLQHATGQMIPIGDLKMLARYGLELKEPVASTDHSFRIQGDTFPHDAILTKAGGLWDSSEEVWFFESDRELNQFLKELSSLMRAQYPGLNETPTPFENDDASQSLVTRLLECGPNAVSNEELLALILSFDRYITHPIDASRALFADFGTLGQILNSPPSRFAKVDGISPRTVALLKAIQLTLERSLNEPLLRGPIIGSWKALFDYLNIKIKNSRKEHSIVLYLDQKNYLLKEESIEGTIDHVPLYPREIASRALELFSKSVILVHNHPSGDPNPSKNDIKTTKQIQIALSSLDIVLHDHIIIGRESHFSFKEESII